LGVPAIMWVGAGIPEPKVDGGRAIQHSPSKEGLINVHVKPVNRKSKTMIFLLVLYETTANKI